MANMSKLITSQDVRWQESGIPLVVSWQFVFMRVAESWGQPALPPQPPLEPDVLHDFHQRNWAFPTWARGTFLHNLGVGLVGMLAPL